MIELIIFLKERRFHLYKDGTWYSNYNRDYSKKQTFYTNEQLLEYFKSETKR
jgi:hypothetical protein